MSNPNFKFNDGVEWLKNKLIKINQVFSNEDGKEGYSILGNQLGTPTGTIINTIQQTKRDSYQSKLILDSSLNDVNNSLTTATGAWKAKTLQYLGDESNYNKKRNYNIFVNRSLDPQDINIPDKYPSYCLRKGAENQGNWLVEAPGFNAAYPAPSTPGSSNFASYDSAKDACKLWAADTGSILFGLTKDATNTKYQCYVGGENPPTAEDFSANNLFTVQKSAYTYATAVDASVNNFSRAQLFYDGRLGVYNYKLDPESSKPINATTPIYNDQMNIPEGYAMCNPWYGGGIKFDSITANFGQNCNNIQTPPLSVRYVLFKHNSNKRIVISALAVYGMVRNQKSQNLARFSTLTGVRAISNSNQSIANNPANNPINGNLSNRGPGGVYISANGNDQYWLLDLQQVAQVYEIVYYNISWRRISTIDLNEAIGMTISLGTNLNEDGSLIVTKVLGPLTNAARQPFPVSAEASTSTGSTKLTPNYIPIPSN